MCRQNPEQIHIHRNHMTVVRPSIACCPTLVYTSNFTGRQPNFDPACSSHSLSARKYRAHNYLVHCLFPPRLNLL